MELDADFDALASRGGRGGRVGHVSYVGALLVSALLLLAGIVVYGRLRAWEHGLPDRDDVLPALAMAYGSLLLLAVGIVEARVRHVGAAAWGRRALALDRLVERLTAAQEREREELSAHLHDRLGARLTALRLELEALARRRDRGARGATACGDSTQAPDDAWRRIFGTMDETLADVRGLSATLYPRLIGTFGLAGAVDEVATRMRAAGTAVHVACADGVGDIAAEPALCALRVVQEGLLNVTRHAQARNTWITLTLRGNRLSGSIEDDGVGCKSPREGLGLTLMRDRLRRLGGTLRTAQSPRGGAGLWFELPIPVADRDFGSDCDGLPDVAESPLTARSRLGTAAVGAQLVDTILPATQRRTLAVAPVSSQEALAS